MTPSGKYFVSRRILINEIIAFVLIILFLWLDEVVDIPALFLGAEETLINWRESLFESLGILAIGSVIVYYTNRIFQRMTYLEGLLSICANCKKIRDEKGNWRQIESYICERSEAEFSHSVCPECAEKLYPEYNLYKKR